MGLTKCRQCGQHVPKAPNCANCGAPQGFKAVRSVIYMLVGFLVLGGFLALKNYIDNRPPKSEKRKTFPGSLDISENISYRFRKLEWLNDIKGKHPNEKWLVIHVSIYNTGIQCRIIKDIELIDEIENMYGPSADGYLIVDDAFFTFEELYPGKRKDGKFVFDVPRNHSYRLRIRTGYGNYPDFQQLFYINPK